MLITLLTGSPVMLLCLILEGLFVVLSLRLYVRMHPDEGHSGLAANILSLSLVMLLMMLGNFVQMALWALLFLLLGEFGDFATALYFSGVTFATLGYGDMVLSPQWRLLSPLASGNGILMFGVSTAVMTAAVIDVMKRQYARRQGREP
jgi:hypothetical protein